MSISVWSEKGKVDVQFSTFPGGEEHVRILGDDIYASVVVLAKISSSCELMRLLMLSEALTKVAGIRHLCLPYVPYARQDRRCNEGEAHSMRVAAKLINSMGFSTVTIVDPHSDVCEALIDNLMVIEQHQIMGVWPKLDAVMSEITNDDYTVIVSPDAGSLKKIFKVAKVFGKPDVLKADKIRDISTGEITGIEIHAEKLHPNVNYMIVDDICDGGRTFIELAKALREKGATRVSLYVTHGIFSKGFRVFDGLIDEIWTTNSVFDKNIGQFRETKINVFNIDNILIKGEI